MSYVGEGELSRFCKIAHNVMLGVVIQNLYEITILAQKAGVPRHAFLEFMNNGVMGSMFTRYKSNALVNLDWTTTFTPELLRKDLDLGLEAGRKLGVPMPVTPPPARLCRPTSAPPRCSPTPRPTWRRTSPPPWRRWRCNPASSWSRRTCRCRRGWKS